MHRFSLFILDDDPHYIQAAKLALGPDWKPIDNFHRADAALIDIHLSSESDDFEGIDRIRKIRAERPQLKIIATSGDLNRSTMEAALDAGCDLFLAKPLDPDKLTKTLDKISAYKQLQDSTRGHLQTPWIGDSDISKNIQLQIANLKGEPGPLLIQGETGTGKEVVAQILHQQEGPSPFVRVNVAALAENLFESELFGHAKGAFTGANSHRPGLIEAADGGDLFLDEIETLTENQQSSLLRFLENGEYKAVGSNETKTAKVRVIAATNRNLDQMVREKSFREDLFWRLSKHKIQLPPLRERPTDIAALADHFLKQQSSSPKKLSEDALLALQKHSWPGNVRELRRICEQLDLQAPLPIIRSEEIQGVIGYKNTASSAISYDFSLGLEVLIKNYEADAIKKCLNEYKNVDDVVRVLKISRSSLYKKIKDHDIQWEKS